MSSGQKLRTGVACLQHACVPACTSCACFDHVSVCVWAASHTNPPGAIVERGKSFLERTTVLNRTSVLRFIACGKSPNPCNPGAGPRLSRLSPHTQRLISSSRLNRPAYRRPGAVILVLPEVKDSSYRRRGLRAAAVGSPKYVCHCYVLRCVLLLYCCKYVALSA